MCLNQQYTLFIHRFCTMQEIITIVMSRHDSGCVYVSAKCVFLIINVTERTRLQHKLRRGMEEHCKLYHHRLRQSSRKFILRASNFAALHGRSPAGRIYCSLVRIDHAMHICMYCKFRVPVMLGPAIKKSKQLIEGFDALSRVLIKSSTIL